MLEEIKDLSGKALEVSVVLEDLRNVQVAHFFAKTFARLNHDVSLHTRVHVVLDVNSVLL